MQKPKVVIVGGGITGISCAYILKNFAEVVIIERNKLGGDSVKGNHRYIQMTPLVKSFFGSLNLPYSDYVVRNGVLLKGNVERLDLSLKEMAKHQRERINADYFRKTRLIEPPNNLKRAMTEPSFSKPMKAIRTGNGLLLEFLVNNIRGVKKFFSQIENIGCKSVSLRNGDTLYYDFLIFTIPLWEIRKYSWWEIPYCNAVKRNVIKISSLHDKYIDWNFVYTPYTPGNCIYRISPYEDKYLVEVNGELENRAEDVLSDLYFLFEEGWYFIGSNSFKGHMLKTDTDRINWPLNIIPLGMYAEWNEQITLDSVLSKVEKLKKRWNL